MRVVPACWSVRIAANGVYPMNIGFHKNAFALVSVPLVVPQGVSFSASETHNNVAMRVIKDYDVNNDVEIIRLDVMYGVKTIYEDLACRLVG